MTVRPVVEPWKLIVRSVVLLGLVFGATVAVRLLDVPIEEFGRRAVARGGLAGVFAFVFLVDTFVVPASLDLLFPVTIDWPPVPLLLVMSVASILGGFAGYWIARGFSRWRYVARTVAAYRARGEHIIERYGIWAVVLAGLTPIPFSTVSWIAGMVRMPPGLYALGALSRAPRIVIYYLLIRAGLTLIG
ncbi:MAG: hypothetical protein EA403_11615 [Spirochaetaceae bacterium]|nr:MAG: hypothetical protein EA403_11615 [Spirochaetaceae bacterium]